MTPLVLGLVPTVPTLGLRVFGGALDPTDATIGGTHRARAALAVACTVATRAVSVPDESGATAAPSPTA